METRDESTLAIVESHKNAAAEHQEAAAAHLKAMKYHAGGDEIQANESAKIAKMHSDKARIFDDEVAQHHGL